MFIPDPAPDFFSSRIGIQGSKKHRMPRTWIRNIVFYHLPFLNFFNCTTGAGQIGSILGHKGGMRDESFILVAHAHDCTVYGIGERDNESNLYFGREMNIHSCNVADPGYEMISSPCWSIVRTTTGDKYTAYLGHEGGLRDEPLLPIARAHHRAHVPHHKLQRHLLQTRRLK
jgi:hypothetical protein